ncbi:MAG: GWxTD domain-containing protein [Candidatus Zixiibacteriota bacterium]
MTRAVVVALLICSIPALFLNGCLSSLREADTLGDETARSIRYISTSKQLRELKKLDSKDEVDRFLRDFWANLDPTPGTPKNEVKQEYDRRFQYAEEHFRESNIPGSQTDRGRVYIIYGPPAEIYLRPMVREDFEEIPGVYTEEKMPPYAEDEDNLIPRNEPKFKKFGIKSLCVWEYDLPAGRGRVSNTFSPFASSKLTFVFADMDGFGELTLVYSTSGTDLDDTRLMFGPMVTGGPHGRTVGF